jgi:hypothetical protein
MISVFNRQARVLACLFFYSSGLSQTWASSCCAGNGAAPNMVTGEDQARLSLSLAASKAVGFAEPTGQVKSVSPGAPAEWTQTALLSAAFLLEDRWQAGIQLPVVRKGLVPTGGSAASGGLSESQFATGLGDIRLNVAYEFLPEWTYSVWKPKGFVFLQVTLPTGKSLYELPAADILSATGRGFYQVGWGGLFLKRWGSWDTYGIPEVHWVLGRSFSGREQLGSGWGGSIAWGVGYSPLESDFRFGVRIQPLYESSRDRLRNRRQTQTTDQLLWNVALESSYLWSPAWALNLIYTDQMLLGPARNTALNRTIAFGIQHRWER